MTLQMQLAVPLDTSRLVDDLDCMFHFPPIGQAPRFRQVFDKEATMTRLGFVDALGSISRIVPVLSCIGCLVFVYRVHTHVLHTYVYLQSPPFLYLQSPPSLASVLPKLCFM